eukprot:gb/GEZN01001391.1/.p1 GENE.gb/GEZN01001391.1/~~gb/GEZN01001391.1/.p1  ORF type:complete len:965 (+),score=154.79 gb/GEZN01001391.1/:33-2897(+)
MSSSSSVLGKRSGKGDKQAQKKRAKVRQSIRKELGGISSEQLKEAAKADVVVAQRLDSVGALTSDSQKSGSERFAKHLPPHLYRNLMRYADVWLRVLALELEQELRAYIDFMLADRVSRDKVLLNCQAMPRQDRKKPKAQKKFHSVHPDFDQDHLRRRNEFQIAYQSRSDNPRGILPGDCCWVWTEPRRRDAAYGQIGQEEGDRVRFQGEVNFILMGVVEVSFSKDHFSEAERRWLENTHVDWRLDFGPSLIQHRRMREAVGVLTSNKSPRELQQILCRMVPPARVAGVDVDPENRPDWDREFHPQDLSLPAHINTMLVSNFEQNAVYTHLANRRVNTSQREAITSAVGKRLTLIQGPPGTGKTSTSVELITLWVQALKRTPVLCCAYSNIAVDNIMEGCVAGGLKCIRYGPPERASRNLLDNMLETKIDEDPQVMALQDKITYQRKQGRQVTDLLSELRKLKQEVELSIVKNTQVVFATCIVSGRIPQEGIHFSLVLIDESTQATEPASLVPITKSSSHVVLVGDHRQLPPVLVMDQMGATRLQTSLFERLLGLGADPREALGMEHGIRAHMLTTQYRMHPILSAWPNYMFYQSQLTDGVTAMDRPAPPGLPWPRADTIGPIGCALIAMTSPEESNSTSKGNQAEAQVLAALVARAIHANSQGEEFGVGPEEIGIVAPYNLQIQLVHHELKRALGSAVSSLIEVKSVDGFQGREKELIFLTCTRSNDTGTIGFLSDARRLNVGLTRARRGLIVIGDPRTLCRDPTWASWLTFVQKNGLIAPIEYCGLSELPHSGQSWAVPDGEASYVETAAYTARPAELEQKRIGPQLAMPMSAFPQITDAEWNYRNQQQQAANEAEIASELPTGTHAQYNCPTCEVHFTSPAQMRQHMTGQKHAHRMKSQQETAHIAASAAAAAAAAAAISDRLGVGRNQLYAPASAMQYQHYDVDSYHQYQ